MIMVASLRNVYYYDNVVNLKGIYQLHRLILGVEKAAIKTVSLIINIFL